MAELRQWKVEAWWANGSYREYEFRDNNKEVIKTFAKSLVETEDAGFVKITEEVFGKANKVE